MEHVADGLARCTYCDEEGHSYITCPKRLIDHEAQGLLDKTEHAPSLDRD